MSDPSDPNNAPPPPGAAPPPPGHGQPEPPYGQPQPPYGGPPPYGQPQPPYGGPPPYGGQPGYPYGGVVPPSLDEIYYKPGLNILLTIVTCGIWGVVWSWRTHDDLQKYNGDGLGGTAALVIAIFASVVIMFTVPNEIEKMYTRDGRESPVTTLWGLWFLLPLIGNLVWYLKVQEALNEFWVSKGARPAM